MHIAQCIAQFHLCYQFCNCLLMVGFLGGCVSFFLAVMTLYGAIGISSAFFLSFSGFFGLVRMIMPPWSTMIEEQDPSLSTDEQTKKHKKKFCELNLETRTLVEKMEKSCLMIRPKARDLSCSICLQCFEVGQEISVVCECRHAFHSSCLKQWAQKSTTCPYCRQDMEKKTPLKDNSMRKRTRLPGPIGIFDGAFESIFDLAS